MKQVIYVFIKPTTAEITTLTVDIPSTEWCTCKDCLSDSKLLERTDPASIEGPNRKFIESMLADGHALCNWHIVTGGESHGECNGRVHHLDTRK